MDATTIGVDLAKTVFELALANAAWRVIGRRRLTRPQFERFLATHPAAHLVMEACGTAHHWARVARAHGHPVSLLPPPYVAPTSGGTKPTARMPRRCSKPCAAGGSLR